MPGGEEKSTRLPALRAWLALERALDLLGDPAAVVRTGLRRHLLIVEIGRIHTAGVEGEVTGELLVSRLGIGVEPGHSLRSLAAGLGVDVGRGPLPFALGVHVLG